MNVTRIVNSVFESNTFLLSINDSTDVWLIDIGDINPILDTLTSKQTIKGVFITHTHYDHIYGINKLIELFPNCKVYTSENGRTGFLSDQYNFSRYHNDSISFQSHNLITLKEGDEVVLTEKYSLRVYETPGHDWSSLVYQINDRFLFTGDSYIPQLKVVTTFPKSNREESEKSVKKIESLIFESTIIFPGHREIFIYSQDKLKNM